MKKIIVTYIVQISIPELIQNLFEIYRKEAKLAMLAFHFLN